MVDLGRAGGWTVSAVDRCRTMFLHMNLLQNLGKVGRVEANTQHKLGRVCDE